MNALALESGYRMQSAIVEDLRCASTAVGMQPPGMREEQPALRRKRARATEQVLQRRHIRTGWMHALLWLLELRRIAEQHDALCRGCDRDCIRERKLSGLVNEQDVDGIDHV